MKIGLLQQDFSTKLGEQWVENKVVTECFSFVIKGIFPNPTGAEGMTNDGINTRADVRLS